MRKLFFSSILLFNFCGASNPIGLPARFDDFLRVNSGYILFKDDPEMAKLDRELLNDIRRTRDKGLIKEFEDLGTDSGEPRITYCHGYESNGVPTLYFGCREQKLSKYPELKQRFDRFNELFQNDKAQKKLFENWCNQKSKEEAEAYLKSKIENEIFSASRAPTPEENEGLQDFLKIAQRHGVNEIRLIDADSLIRSMYFSEELEEKRQHLLSLLSCRSQVSIDQEIDEFIEASEFSISENSSLWSKITGWCRSHKRKEAEKNAFKEAIRKSLKEQSRTSEVFRDEILTLIARSLSEPALYDLKQSLETHGISDLLNRKIIFERADSSIARYDKISINLPERVYEHTIGKNSEIKLTLPLNDCIYHEIGHIITLNMLDDSISKTMEIAAESAVQKKNSSKDKRISRRILESTVKSIGKTIDFLSGWRIGNWIRKKFLEKVCKLLFNDQREVAQILGFFVHNHNEQPVLYLNMLSDFARSVKDRTPVRTDHLGQVSSWSIYNIVNATASQKIRSTLSVNPEFYDALFCAHGIGGIDGYFRNLEDRKSQ